MLGVGYALLGIALAVQEVLGTLPVRWDVLLPALVVVAGLLLVGSAVVAGRRADR